MSMQRIVRVSLFFSLSFLCSWQHVYSGVVAENKNIIELLSERCDIKVLERCFEDLCRKLDSFAHDHEEYSKTMIARISAFFQEHEGLATQFFDNPQGVLQTEKVFLRELLATSSKELMSSSSQMQALGVILVDIFDTYPEVKTLLDELVQEFQDDYPDLAVLHAELNKGLSRIRFAQEQIEKLQEAPEF